MTKTFTTISAALLCLLYSCTTPPSNTAAQRRADSLALQAKAAALAKQMLQHQQDSIARAQDSLAKIRPKATGGPCPVAVKKCSLANDNNGKSVIVALKNVSGKKVVSVRIAWTVYNKAGKAIGASSGMAKKALAPGKSSSYSWGINAPNAVRAKASVLSVHYQGGVWNSGN